MLSGTPTQTGTFPIVVTATDSQRLHRHRRDLHADHQLPGHHRHQSGRQHRHGGRGRSARPSRRRARIGTATFTLDSGTLPAGLTLATAASLRHADADRLVPDHGHRHRRERLHRHRRDLHADHQLPDHHRHQPGQQHRHGRRAFSQTFTADRRRRHARRSPPPATLPAGLTLATDGMLSGTPTQTGTFPIVVTATDANGCTGTGATYNADHQLPDHHRHAPGTTTGTVDAPFSQTFTQTDAIGTATFTTARRAAGRLTLSTTGCSPVRRRSRARSRSWSRRPTRTAAPARVDLHADHQLPDHHRHQPGHDQRPGRHAASARRFTQSGAVGTRDLHHRRRCRPA